MKPDESRPKRPANDDDVALGFRLGMARGFVMFSALALRHFGIAAMLLALALVAVDRFDAIVAVAMAIINLACGCSRKIARFKFSRA